MEGAVGGLFQQSLLEVLVDMSLWWDWHFIKEAFEPNDSELTSACICLADLEWITTSYYILECSLNASDFTCKLQYYN